MTEYLLEIDGLTTSIAADNGRVRIVDGVDFGVKEGEVVGIVGESGSGKSVLCHSIMGLLDQLPECVVSGSVRLAGSELSGYTEKQMRSIRGNEISMIFQEPMTSLNPVLKIGDQLRESVRLHLGYSRRAADNHAAEMLGSVGIPSPREMLSKFPHELSGGMRQRVMIAIALSCNPKLLIADEPTTALDVTIQAQILELLKQVKAVRDMAIVVITHDLGVIAEMADRVLVMYAGRVLEEAQSKKLFDRPNHPYSIGLIDSLPERQKGAESLYSIPGTVAEPGKLPQGCKFAPRCPFVMEVCRREEPGLRILSDGRKSRCWLNEPTVVAQEQEDA